MAHKDYNGMSDDKIPGVTLKLQRSRRVQGSQGRQRALLEFEADITDAAVWRVVEKELEKGVRIDTVQDLDAGIREVLCEKVEALEKELRDLRRENQLLDLKLQAYKVGVLGPREEPPQR